MDKERKQAYRHDYIGACAPGRSILLAGQGSISVGIFQRVPKASSKGLKRTAVKLRVTGKYTNPVAVRGGSGSLPSDGRR